MGNSIGLVEVGLGQSTSPENGIASLALRKLGGKSLVEWVARRVTEATHLDGVIAVLGDTPEQREFGQLIPLDIPVCYSSRPDPLARVAEAISEYRATEIVYVSVESPFVDPQMIDRLLMTAKSNPTCDYISYCSQNGQAARSRLGVLAEWCRAESLKRANREATAPADRNDITRYLCGHPELFQLRLMPLPERLDRDDVRLVLNVEEDWDHAEAIVEALGAEALAWQRIAGFLDHQPAIRQRMAVLNRTLSAC